MGELEVSGKDRAQEPKESEKSRELKRRSEPAHTECKAQFKLNQKRVYTKKEELNGTIMKEKVWCSYGRTIGGKNYPQIHPDPWSVSEQWHLDQRRQSASIENCDQG